MSGYQALVHVKTNLGKLFEMKTQPELNEDNLFRVHSMVQSVMYYLTQMNTRYKTSWFTTKFFRLHQLQLHKTSCVVMIKLISDFNQGVWLVPYFKLVIEHIENLQKIE